MVGKMSKTDWFDEALKGLVDVVNAIWERAKNKPK